MMSPSCTTYSLPSRRSSPCSRHAAHRSARDEVVVGHDLGADEAARDVAVDLARRLLSAVVPRGIVQARHSSSPTVKNEMRPSRW